MIEVRNRNGFDDYLNSILDKTESDDLEFKSAAGGFPGSFWDTYSAFANSEGGTIVLGVIEKKNRFYLDSLTTEQVAKYTKDFWNNVNNRSTISCNLLKTEDVVVENYKGHLLMLFFIPRASREQRPVYRTTQPYNGTFKRNHEGDYKCTEKEVQRMFADANVSNPADSRILENYSMEDIDEESVAQYRQLFKLAKPNHPWLVLSDFDFLRKLGAYRADRREQKEGFTMAGMLMFGKSDSITDNECCPDFFPDYQEKLSEDSQVRWTNRICPDGTWEANLFQFYLRVLPRLQAILPKPFKLEDNIRREDSPTHVAVREALVNALIHADYSENSTTIISLYPNKMVFANPGTLLVSKSQYYEGAASVCRNKSLQKMFMMIGSAEKAGSGVDKILSGWNSVNWRSPILKTSCQPDKVELTMLMESLIDSKIQEELVTHYGDGIFLIGHDRLMVLNAICADGYVTNESLRFVLGMHKGQISELLKDMCKHHILEVKGYGRGTKYYMASSSSNIASSDSNIASSSSNMASSGSNMASSGSNMASLGSNMASLGSNMASSGSNMASSGSNMASSGSNMVSSDSNMASSITGFQLKQRMSYEELKMIVLESCSDWKTLDELSVLIKRTKKYLRNFILPKMLHDNSLEMLFPGVPKHPNQKYKKR